MSCKNMESRILSMILPLVLLMEKYWELSGILHQCLLPIPNFQRINDWTYIDCFISLHMIKERNWYLSTYRYYLPVKLLCSHKNFPEFKIDCKNIYHFWFLVTSLLLQDKLMLWPMLCTYTAHTAAYPRHTQHFRYTNSMREYIIHCEIMWKQLQAHWEEGWGQLGQCLGAHEFGGPTTQIRRKKNQGCGTLNSLSCHTTC